jgi:translocator protein
MQKENKIVSPKMNIAVPLNPEPSLKAVPFFEIPAVRIVLSVLFIAAVAALGSLFTDTSSKWYAGLIKPSLQPPGIVFPIVWTVLYILLAISLSLIAADPKADKNILFLHAANGLLNVLWSYVFFQKQNPAGAFFILIILIITATILFSEVYRVNKTAAYLLMPYIIWLWFALYLNYEIAFIN